ncbi:DUF1326 domain-containing protein [Geodermatophilus normandii]|uniref:DUF1326 domain-containing protein n=1 Tax=Geodermatophilus normandii TaxID=1137989 RepID=UPI000D7199C3|nr:DUF1326 domain-containing protein [Geodermatophilus normandii]
MTTTGSGTQLHTDVLEGWFIETCDCESLCPCWVDDDPDDDHCTGLFAWVIDHGRVSGVDGLVDVGGARVVSISTHNGRRRDPDGGRYSVLFVDVDDVVHREDAYDALERAFGAPRGPLADLSEVMGAVLSVSPAEIRVEGEGAGGRTAAGASGSTRSEGSTTPDTPPSPRRATRRPSRRTGRTSSSISRPARQPRPMARKTVQRPELHRSP